MVFAQLNSFFALVSANYLNGMPVDQVRLASALLMTVPLGLVFKLIKGGVIRHIIGTVLGLFLQYLVYSDEIIHVIGQTIIVYVLILIFKRKSAVIVFVESLIFLSGHHLYRQIYSYGAWDLDISTVLMMTVCKWTSFAWCYADGGKDEAKLSADQKTRSLKKLPNFFEYFSFITFFGSAVCGPNFDYYDFDLFINQRDVFAKIPFTLFESLLWIGKGAIFSLSTVFLLPQFPLKYILTDAYLQGPLYKQFFFFNICIILLRVKYYAGWSLSQAGLAATGATYNGKTEHGKNKWDRIISCVPSNEFSYDMRYKVECWNSSVQVWLKKYVYLRIYSEEQLRGNAKRATISQYITNIVSAFWHGFYPGYYSTFFFWSLLISCGKQFHNASINKAHVFKRIRSIVSTPVFVIVRFLMCNVMLNCFGIGFQLLSLESGHIYYKAHYYSCLIVLVSVIAFFNITGWGQRKSKRTHEEGKNHHGEVKDHHHHEADTKQKEGETKPLIAGEKAHEQHKKTPGQK